LGPFDCWLALRGLKTMALRMEKQQENCLKMAKWLEAHPMVNLVNYPGRAMLLRISIRYALNRRTESAHLYEHASV
jgi:cystathionine beta-lyase/cystathionine gamma-synthase